MLTQTQDMEKSSPNSVLLWDRNLFTPEQEEYRQYVRGYIREHFKPFTQRWDGMGRVPREVFAAATKAGLYCMNIPKKYGGVGLEDFRYNVIVSEELEYADCGSVFLPLGSDIVLPYFLHAPEPAQDKWLPLIAQGKVIAVAMSEPEIGSDLLAMGTTATENEDGTYVLNGRKMWISNGAVADLVVIVARTIPLNSQNPQNFPKNKKYENTKKSQSLSLFVVEKGTPGFQVVKTVSKIGRHSQDTAILSLKNVVLQPSHLLGVPGSAFATLMRNLPQERLGIAVAALAGARRVLSHTINYMRRRELFQRTVGDFQYPSFLIADMCAKINSIQCLCDHAIRLHCRMVIPNGVGFPNSGNGAVGGDCGHPSASSSASTSTSTSTSTSASTSTPSSTVVPSLPPSSTSSGCSSELASMVKWQATELYSKVADECLQFFGGYGYLRHAPVAKHWTAARVTMIYGGANEVMREIVARKLGFSRAPAPASSIPSPATAAIDNAAAGTTNASGCSGSGSGSGTGSGSGSDGSGSGCSMSAIAEAEEALAAKL